LDFLNIYGYWTFKTFMDIGPDQILMDIGHEKILMNIGPDKILIALEMASQL
jgi:hypothetical protein